MIQRAFRIRTKTCLLNAFRYLVLVKTQQVFFRENSNLIISARSTAFLVLELARRPDIQAKIRQEIQQIAGDAQDWTKYRPVYEDLNKMKYIDNVMKEAQRLWPIAPHLVRMAVNDDTYENIHLPKGVKKIKIMEIMKG